MTRLIDADALDAEMYHKSFEVDDGRNVWNSGLWIRYKIFEEAIRDAPTVDAVPVRHGKWIPRYIKIAGRDYKHGMQCSVCAEPALDAEGDDYLTDYCPNCGARMDKE